MTIAISNPTYGVDADDQDNLLRKVLSVILAPVAHIGGTGLASWNEAAQPQPCGFFVRKISVHHVMADCAEHSKEWPGASSVGQLRSVCHPMIGLIRRQVYHLIREAIMSQNKSAQNSEQNTPNSTGLNPQPAKSQSCVSVELPTSADSAPVNQAHSEQLLTNLQRDIDATIKELSAAKLSAHQAEFFTDEMRRAKSIHDTLKKNINDDDSLFIRTIINRVFEIIAEIRAEAKIVKADTSAQLLTTLQQELDSTISVLSNVHIAQFGYALNRIQATIDHFNNRFVNGCTQQVADILGLQLEEIREATQKHRA